MAEANVLGDFEKSVLGDQYVPDAPPAEAVVETPEVETPVVEAPPVVETPVVETPVVEGAVTPPVETPKTSFEINEINQRFETKFTDEDSLKSFLTESPQKIEALEKQIKEMEAMKEENLMLRKSLDPMQYFETEDDFKAAIFKKQFPDKDPTVAYQLLTTDVKALSDKDVLAYEKMLNTPGLDKSDVMAVLDEKYGIEEGEELDRVGKAKMRMDATQARQSIAALKNEIKMPDKVDVDSLTAQQREMQTQKRELRQDGWKNITQELSKTMSDIVYKDDAGNELFKYSIGNDFPQDVLQDVVNALSQGDVEVSREAASQVALEMKEKFIARNHEKIVKLAMDHVKNKAEEERLIKQHNPGSDTPDGTPPSPEGRDYSAEFESKIGGFQPVPGF